MNSWNVPGQSDARGAIRNLAKTNIIFVLATRFRGGARVPARLVFRHVFIATFDAPIPTCGSRLLHSRKTGIGVNGARFLHRWPFERSTTNNEISTGAPQHFFFLNPSFPITYTLSKFSKRWTSKTYIRA